MKDIQTAMFPLLFLLCLCGIGVFEYPQDQPRLYFTIFYGLASWVLHIYIILQINIFVNKFMVPLPMLIKVTIIFGGAYTLLGLHYNKRLKNCFKKLNVVNDTLEAIGIPKDYAKLRLQIVWTIIGWTFSIFFMNIIDGLWLLARIPTSYAAITFCLPFVVNYSYHVDMIHDVIYLALMGYIGSLFGHINRHIQKLTTEKKRIRFVRTICASSFQHETNTVKINQAIYILMHVHFELSAISHELSKIFGLQMLMQTTAFYTFTVQLVMEVYKTFIMLQTNTEFTYQLMMDTISVCMWIANGIARMFLFNYMCEKICSTANATEAFLSRLANISLDIELRENITQFLLQLLKKPLTVSVLGLYNFGYKFTCTVCSFQTNYMPLLLHENSHLINSFALN